MKKIGIIILLIGLLFTLITTFGVLVYENADPGSMAQIKIHHRVWEPMVGTILILIGTGMYKAAKKSKVKNPMPTRSFDLT